MSETRRLTYSIRPKLPAGDGRAWRFGGIPTTVIEGDEHRKSLAGWDGDEALARECADWSAAQGFKGVPSSPADLWHRAARAMRSTRGRIPWTVNVILAGYFHGGWQEVLRPGHVPEPVAYYDLRSAYRWAGCLPLPDPSTYRQYRKGDKRFVGIIDMSHRDKWRVPEPFNQWRMIVTHEDIEAYGLHGEIVAGVSWEKEDRRAARVFDKLDGSELPERVVKMAGRGYWGAWSQLDGVECQVYRGGRVVSSHWLPPRSTDVPAAAIIVHRVIRRVWEQVEAAWGPRQSKPGAVLVATDALLTPQPIEVGPNVGDWAIKETAPEGVFALAPGRWSPVPLSVNLSEWLKTSGIVRNSDAFIDVEACNAMRRRKLLAEAELQRLMDRRARGIEGDRVAESARIRQILSSPANPWRGARAN